MKQPYSHITDSYFLAKLEAGLISYKPDEWLVLDDAEDNAEHKKKGRK